MDGWTFILAWLIVSIAAIVTGSVRLRQHKGYPGASLLALGTVLLVAPVAYVVWGLFYGGTVPSVYVESLDPPNDPGLTIEIRNRTSFDGGNDVEFRAGSVEQVVRTFQDQHPDGVVTTADPVRTSNGTESVWHLSTEDVRYELVYNPDSDFYGLTTQAVVVDRLESGPNVRIPFPRSALDATELREGQLYANTWSPDQWADFYADISLSDVDGNTITVPTNRGGTATITLDQETAMVAVNPQPR